MLLPVLVCIQWWVYSTNLHLSTTGDVWVSRTPKPPGNT